MAFDRPSSFDLTRAVEVHTQGTLYKTALLSVEDDGTVRSTDLADPGRSWTTALPDSRTRDYLMPPFVVGNVVVVATGETREADSDGKAHYVINMAGVDVEDGSVLWNHSEQIGHTFLPPDSTPSPPPYPPLRQRSLEAVERDGDVLLTFYHVVSYPSILLDPADGQVRWKSHVNTIPTMSGGYAASSPPVVSGRYTVGAYNAVMYSLDLETGEVATEPLLEGRSRQVDPADPAYIILHPDKWDSSQRLLRFSTVDGTVQSFVPDPDDARYNGDYDCPHQDDPVWVCFSASPPYYAVGLDSASGELRWSEDATLDDLVVFHGNVYLTRAGGAGYAVIDRSTGRSIASDIGFGRGPIQVNEYGALGRAASGPLDGRWIWAPASG